MRWQRNEYICSIGGMNGTEARNFTLIMMMMMMKHLSGRFERDAEGDICPI
jgi:hypothetical protein